MAHPRVEELPDSPPPELDEPATTTTPATTTPATTTTECATTTTTTSTSATLDSARANESSSGESSGGDGDDDGGDKSADGATSSSSTLVSVDDADDDDDDAGAPPPPTSSTTATTTTAAVAAAAAATDDDNSDQTNEKKRDEHVDADADSDADSDDADSTSVDALEAAPTLRDGADADAVVHDDARERDEQWSDDEHAERNALARDAKERGNAAYRDGDYDRAVAEYGRAVTASTSRSSERHIFYANRAAAHMMAKRYDDVVEDCNRALAVEPRYCKALMRRAAAFEALDEPEAALEDYKQCTEIDGAPPMARAKCATLPAAIAAKQEKQKEEMIGKLKELGNGILGKFGLSTDNFQFVQDPATGGYSVNFKQ